MLLPMTRVGRVRCGDATSTTATATETRTIGNRGTSPRSNVTFSAFQSSLWCVK